MEDKPKKSAVNGTVQCDVKLNGKTVLITGANQGIGFETALDLAGRGARVILACRDLEKAEAAKEKIKETVSPSDIVVMKLDLASLDSIREFSKAVNENESHLDILINNACTGVTCNSLHPGIIKTNLGQYMRGDHTPFFRRMLYTIAWPLAMAFFMTPKQGAQTSIYCSIAPELADVTGKYFAKCGEEPLMTHALNKEDAKKLWELSEKWIAAKETAD
ncbi:unnamed protein product [Clavelina lepadiformis]|uniref:Uncharacterized protein n=1 Tax=Clavelina lepadiformis TaxID=159417 RepID=A0ABP0GZ39_CLALP